MQKEVAIIGIGITPFKARYLDKTYFELAYDATKRVVGKEPKDLTNEEWEIIFNNGKSIME